MMKRSIFLLLTAALLYVTPAGASNIQYSDSNDWTTSSWSITNLYFALPPSSSSRSDFDPGYAPSRSLFLQPDGSAPFSYIVNLNPSWFVDPTVDGAITDISGTIDVLDMMGGGPSIVIAAQQGGIDFFNVIGPLPPGGWQTLPFSQIQAGFQRADGNPGTLDISAAGPPIIFGMGLEQSGAGSTVQALADNYFVAITTSSPPIPEPGTLCLLAAGAVGLLGYGWRRRRQ